MSLNGIDNENQELMYENLNRITNNNNVNISHSIVNAQSLPPPPMQATERKVVYNLSGLINECAKQDNNLLDESLMN